MQPLPRAVLAFSRALAIALFMLASTLTAEAVQPDEILKNSSLEARARKLSADLRCLICQNQSIDDSDAPLAKDLRIIVRERLVAGDSDVEVKQYLVARYGDFVLLRPPFSLNTLLLWASPILLLLAAAYAAWVSFGGTTRTGPNESARQPEVLTPEEQAKLDLLLSDLGKG